MAWTFTTVFLCSSFLVSSPQFAFAAATGGKLAVPNVMAASVPVPRGFRSAVDKSNPWHEYWLESIYVEISGLLALAVWTVMLRGCWTGVGERS